MLWPFQRFTHTSAWGRGEASVLSEPGLVGVGWYPGKRRQSEPSLTGDGGFPCLFQASLFPSQLLTLQLLGRSAVPDTPDGYHLLPGHALQRRDRERCRGVAEQALYLGNIVGDSGSSRGLLVSLTPRSRFPCLLCHGPADAAFPTHASGCGHPAPGLQCTCCGGGEGGYSEAKGCVCVVEAKRPPSMEC